MPSSATMEIHEKKTISARKSYPELHSSQETANMDESVGGFQLMSDPRDPPNITETQRSASSSALVLEQPFGSQIHIHSPIGFLQIGANNKQNMVRFNF